MPAEQAGLAGNDLILSVNGDEIATWEELVEDVNATASRWPSSAAGRPDPGRTVVPETQDNQHLRRDVGKVYLIGIERGGGRRWASSRAVAGRAADLFRADRLSLVKMVQGKGPAARARRSDPSPGSRASARGGLERLLQFMAFLCVNLGVLNLLPIPALDGGHLAFFAVEAVLRRPLAARSRDRAAGGSGLLLSLMVFVFYNDIHRWCRGER